VTTDPPAADATRLRGPIAIRVAGARGERGRWLLGPENPDYAPLSRISANLRAAFVAAEDSRFFAHRGFDVPQLKRAFLANLAQGRLGRGGSTISQQLVKNVFFDGRRNLSRKLQEAVITWRLEQVISKQRILELYLNLVEMGPGIHGVTQAARAYFRRPPAALTRTQAAQLAALTPSPRQLGQRLRENATGQAWTDKIQTLLRIMRRSAPRAAPRAGEQVSLLAPRPR
jgi:monofunctional biosynthetic peptidoglycan transglycosylase